MVRKNKAFKIIKALYGLNKLKEPGIRGLMSS